MRDLLAQKDGDERAADAVALFCNHANKWIGSFAAALCGLGDAHLRWSIGENAPFVTPTHL